MGAGPLPMNPGVRPGPDLPPVGNPMGAQPGGDVMAAKQRLMQIMTEAESILTQFPNLAGELMGGGPEGGVGGVGGVPQMPVGGNTGLPGAMPGLIA